MKLQIVLFICIGSALAVPSIEVTSAPEVKHIVVENHPDVNPVPVRGIEHFVSENQPIEEAKENLEPAATGWGYRGWGGLGYGGYGGYYNNYGGHGRGWGGNAYRPNYGGYYGGYRNYW